MILGIHKSVFITGRRKKRNETKTKKSEQGKNETPVEDEPEYEAER